MVDGDATDEKRSGPSSKGKGKASSASHGGRAAGKRARINGSDAE